MRCTNHVVFLPNMESSNIHIFLRWRVPAMHFQIQAKIYDATAKTWTYRGLAVCLFCGREWWQIHRINLISSHPFVWSLFLSSHWPPPNTTAVHPWLNRENLCEFDWSMPSKKVLVFRNFPRRRSPFLLRGWEQCQWVVRWNRRVKVKTTGYR